MESDTPETDAAREVWLFEKPNVVLGDGRPIHDNVVDVRFARRMERQRDEAIARADQAELRMMRAKRERDKAWAARDRLANCIKNSYEVMSLENDQAPLRAQKEGE